MGEQGAAKSINRSNDRSPLHCSFCLLVPIILSLLFVAADRPVRKIVADCVNPVAFEKVVGEFYDQTRQNQQRNDVRNRHETVYDVRDCPNCGNRHVGTGENRRNVKPAVDFDRSHIAV